MLIRRPLKSYLSSQGSPILTPILVPARFKDSKVKVPQIKACRRISHSPFFPISTMFARLTQLSRHLARPLPNYAHSPVATQLYNYVMTSSSASATAAEKSRRTIHTAACLVIGDEVLGGKVRATVLLGKKLIPKLMIACRR